MNSLDFDRPTKCFFCEHDRGRLAKTKPASILKISK